MERVGSLSGLTRAQAQPLIESRLAIFQDQIELFKFGSKRVPLKASDLGLSYDPKETARQAYNVARRGSLPFDLFDEVKALIWGIKMKPSYRLDPLVWSQKIGQLLTDLSGRPARFVFRGQLMIEAEKEGVVLTQKDLEKEILARFLADSGNSLAAGWLPVDFNLTAADLRPQEDAVGRLLKNRPSLYLSSRNFTLEENDFLDLISLSREASPTATPTQVQEWVASLSAQVNRPARSLSFEAQGGKVVKFTPGRDGLRVKESDLTARLSEEIILGLAKRIEVPVEKTLATVAANDYGIRELLAEGVSNFSHSIPGRRRNILRASLRLNGVLLPPEAVFSFNESVGEISAQTGYDYAYIISEGRTILGTGGGVCQVSTTVFRTALNAGLPILARSAHAYRVRYYEQGGSPPGLDATVFSPSVDLKFKNDTGYYLLIQSIFEDEDDTLIFRFYGSKDGRRVEIETPQILASSSAPAPLYQEDASLSKGVVRQIDFAAPGARVLFERKVTKDGTVTLADKFYSNYKPWRAIYLVGAKE